MRLILTIFLALVLITSVSAFVEMHSGNPQYFYHAKDKGMCYLDSKAGLVCPTTKWKTDIYRNDTIKECYFDRTRGAVCPHYPALKGLFESKRVGPMEQFQYQKYQLPKPVPEPHSIIISGSFRPRWDPIYTKSKYIQTQ